MAVNRGKWCPDGHARPGRRPVIPGDPGGATAGPAPGARRQPPAATPASPGTGVAVAGPPAQGGRRAAGAADAARMPPPGWRAPGPRGSRRVLGTTGNGGLAMTT